MLSVAALTVLAAAGAAGFWYACWRPVRRQESQLEGLKQDHLSLFEENERLERQNRDLEEYTVRSIDLYEITREMCRSFDQAKIFAHFRQGLHRFVPSGICFFEKGDELPVETENGVVVPLVLDKRMFGYLRCERIDPQNKEIFHILSQQFLLAIRRAMLYEQVQSLIITDGLTQTLSRRYFLERFGEEVERSRKFQLPLAFLMIDVDHFKECNDKYGHLAGDAVLRRVSILLKETVRQMDFIGRYGGEELSLVLVETDREHALLAAERIRAAMEQEEVEVYEERVRVTISIGVASFPDDAVSAGELIEKADSALYQAKARGRNRVVAAG